MGDNTITGNYAQGIGGADATGTVIDGNDIEDNGQGGGQYVYFGIYLSGVEDTQITDNTLFENYWRGSSSMGTRVPSTSARTASR